MITNERLSFWATSYAKHGDADTMEKIEMAIELISRRAKDAKPTADGNGDAWIIGWNTCRWEECIEQLQLRLEAVENEMRKR